MSAVRRVRPGLSPPTRGSLLHRPGQVVVRGSIPAHAGKPDSGTGSQVRRGVYPRPRGEATPRGTPLTRTWGLSPPTRGSRRYGRCPGGGCGSIPAHAGKPARRARSPSLGWVYPRPRGEASLGAASVPNPSGLSPPTRGSRVRREREEVHQRSIPAHAGKPAGSHSCNAGSQVYPRPRGEATLIPRGWRTYRGLSPPTRGSLRNAPPTAGRHGRRRSIPAHAGKPTWRASGRSPDTVYPRPRGEAGSSGRSCGDLQGLSPPTRGSLHMEAPRDLGDGSIPAHAGKPARSDAAPAPAAVYPRPRGEAMEGVRRAARRRGLSPPTRGSRPGGGESCPIRRSIPAHAGKPR